MSLLPKKLGEVLAFAYLGLELLDRAGATAEGAYGSDMASDLRHRLTDQVAYLTPLADAAKAKNTLKKVRGMMEQYIGDEWDNPIELLEWSGFYLGAAGIHWSLVAGLAVNQDHTLTAFANTQAALFTHWLDVASDRIKHQTSPPIS